MCKTERVSGENAYRSFEKFSRNDRKGGNYEQRGNQKKYNKQRRGKERDFYKD